MEPEERRGALPPKSSVCPVNRAISCFNKHIYWECFSFSVESLSALSHRTVGQSGRRKATRRTTRCRENTRGRWHSSEWWRLKSVSTMGKLAEGFTQGREMPGRGDLKDWETGTTRGGIGCLARDHPLKGDPSKGAPGGGASGEEANRRRDKPVKRRPTPCNGRLDEGPALGREARRRADPGNGGSAKSRPWEERPSEGQTRHPGKGGPVKGRPVKGQPRRRTARGRAG